MNTAVPDQRKESQGQTQSEPAVSKCMYSIDIKLSTMYKHSARQH